MGEASVSSPAGTGQPRSRPRTAYSLATVNQERLSATRAESIRATSPPSPRRPPHASPPRALCQPRHPQTRATTGLQGGSENNSAPRLCTVRRGVPACAERWLPTQVVEANFGWARAAGGGGAVGPVGAKSAAKGRRRQRVAEWTRKRGCGRTVRMRSGWSGAAACSPFPVAPAGGCQHGSSGALAQGRTGAQTTRNPMKLNENGMKLLGSRTGSRWSRCSTRRRG